MARLPIYTQQTLPEAGRADASMMGGATAQTVAQAGSVLQDIGVTMKRREDVIDRTIRARDFDAFARESLTALETQDLARKETVDQYSQGLRAKMDELMAGHAGTASSRAEFRNQLENQIAQYEQGARSAQVKAQHTMIGNIIEERTNILAVDAGFAPDMIGEIFSQIDSEIDQFGDALPTGMIEQYKNSARGAIAQTAIQRLQNDGNFEAARELMSNPDVAKNLAPNVSRQLTINNVAGQAKQDREARQREANVQSWAMAMGIDPENMTPQQRMLAENASTQTMNYVEKINLATMLNGGQPLAPEVRDRIMKIDRAGTRTQVQDLISQMPAFESGRMSDDERAAFLVQAEKIFPTQYRLNQANGQQEPIPNSGGIAKLAETIGRPLGGAQPRQPAPGVPIGGTPAGASGDMGMDNSFVDDQGRTDFRALPPQPGEPGFVGEVDEAAQVIGAAPMTEQAGGLWNLADRIAGPVAGVRRGIGGGPVDIGIGQQEVAAAQEVQLQQRNLVRALQQNPRYAEGERKDIAVSISIEPEVLSNPTAYRTRLIQIGRYVQEEIAYQTSVLNQPASETTVEMRKQAMQAIPLFQKFQQRLGLPPTVRTPEEALKMRPRPPQVLTPDGRLLDVPQE